MIFLIQSKLDDNNLVPIYDWQIELINNINYQNKNRPEEDQMIYYTSTHHKYPKEYIPVGSVEFVHNFMKYNNIPIPKPINIPPELFRMAEIEGLDPEIISTDKRISLLNSKFIKSTTEIKHLENGIVFGIRIGEWQITNIVDIDIEIRCFIFNGILLDIKPYSGKWWTTNFNSLDGFIKRLINIYKSAPPVYTLDIGIKKHLEKDDLNYEFHRDKYYIIEAHNFYSCGLYGFSFRGYYPQMLSQWYYWWLKKNGIKK
jgi:hypothetical protein